MPSDTAVSQRKASMDQSRLVKSGLLPCDAGASQNKGAEEVTSRVEAVSFGSGRRWQLLSDTHSQRSFRRHLVERFLCAADEQNLVSGVCVPEGAPCEKGTCEDRVFLFYLFRSDLQFFCFRLRRLEGHGLLPCGESPRRTAGGRSNNRFCFE